MPESSSLTSNTMATRGGYKTTATPYLELNPETTEPIENILLRQLAIDDDYPLCQLREAPKSRRPTKSPTRIDHPTQKTVSKPKRPSKAKSSLRLRQKLPEVPTEHELRYILQRQ
ncbi:uncharacterized protein VTP21DRAFT_9159 [Calcarisporiella thermophila]|uniref:uncharacterized protein n=1 Tax=Calcarisporiella thermophila TaxID=911321 RepID=UPI0037435AED